MNFGKVAAIFALMEKSLNIQNALFAKIVDVIYGLPIADKLELKNLVEYNIAEERRNEMKENNKASVIEHKKGELKFSNDIKELKKML